MKHVPGRAGDLVVVFIVASALAAQPGYERTTVRVPEAATRLRGVPTRRSTGCGVGCGDHGTSIGDELAQHREYIVLLQ